MRTVHIIAGPIGAGKTTTARRLAEEYRALRFSLDEWVMELFAREAPEPMIFEWWADRCERCRARIWSVCRDLLARDIDVVLDFGFPGAAQREEYRARALQIGATVHLHFVNTDASLRWERVQTRNQQRGDTFALPVTERMFAASESWWEPPTATELAGVITFHPRKAAPSGG
jgi:predicted kinase